MEDLLEIIIGLFFVEADNEEDDEAYSKEYALLYQVMKNEGFEDDILEAIKWIDPELIVF